MLQALVVGHVTASVLIATGLVLIGCPLVLSLILGQLASVAGIDRDWETFYTSK